MNLINCNYCSSYSVDHCYDNAHNAGIPQKPVAIFTLSTSYVGEIGCYRLKNFENF
jgi:hypothetical protein